MAKDIPVKIFEDNIAKARRLQKFLEENEGARMSLQSIINMCLASNLNSTLKRTKTK